MVPLDPHGSTGGLRPRRPGRWRDRGRLPRSHQRLTTAICRTHGIRPAADHIRTICNRPNEYAALLKGVELAKSGSHAGSCWLSIRERRNGASSWFADQKGTCVRVSSTLGSNNNGEQAQMAGLYRGRSWSAIATICPNSSSGMRTSWSAGKCRVCLDQLGKKSPEARGEVIPNLIPLGSWYGCRTFCVRSADSRLADHLSRRSLTTLPRRRIRISSRKWCGNRSAGRLPSSISRLMGRCRSSDSIRGWIEPLPTRPMLPGRVVSGLDPLVAQKLLAALKQAAERMVGRGHNQ